jgi:3-hydroxy-9,10-secoandrosta-1,3,5(10)-triene-9,17-dione monooxygenase
MEFIVGKLKGYLMVRARQTTSLHEQAAAVIEVLQRNASQTEDERRIPDENIKALTEAGLFRIAMPRRFGGYEADIQTVLQVSAELGRGCGSTSWVTALINSTIWMIGLFSDQAQQDVFRADPDARACSVISPASNSSQHTKNGWVITGKWPFASGSLHSQWAVLGMPIVNDDGHSIDHGLALVPMTDLRIEDTWYVAGMRGTGSNTIVADELFVPEHRILSVTKAIHGRLPAQHGDNTLYRSAFMPVLALVLAGPLLGLARGALEVVEASLAKGKPISQTFYDNAALAPSTQLQLAEAAQLIDTAELHMQRAASDIDRWAISGQYMPVLHRARVRMDTGYIARRCREAVDVLLNINGGNSFAEFNSLQRIWRDLATASRHAIVSRAVVGELYGRALLGIDDQITDLI